MLFAVFQLIVAPSVRVINVEVGVAAGAQDPFAFKKNVVFAFCAAVGDVYV